MMPLRVTYSAHSIMGPCAFKLYCICVYQQRTIMGNECENISEAKRERLEMMTTFDEALAGNLDKYAQDVPVRSYAHRSAECPMLSQKVTDVLTREMERDYVNEENVQGHQLPPFYIGHKKAYYRGEWSQGLPHGQGKVYYTTGGYFQGYFNQGQAFGSNPILIFPDGSFYRGEVNESRLHGRGRFESPGRVVYQGQWRNDKPHGVGEEKFADGSSYSGQFERGLKHGQGLFRWADGRVYDGEWREGKMTGRGTLSKGNAGLFSGPFLNNMKVGRGRLETARGVFEGSFQDGLFEGYGKFTWKDGKVYEGQFKRGRLEGVGTLTFPKGQIIHGQWQGGRSIRIDEIVPRK